MPELDNPPEDYPVRGRDLMTGIPKEILGLLPGDRTSSGQEHFEDRRSHSQRLGTNAS